MAEGDGRPFVMGQIVDAVGYMSMSMRINPSMHRALLFAARNVDEPLASQLRRVVVDVELRRFDTLEEAFMDLARAYGPDNEEFQQALRSLRVAELQTSSDGVERALDRATSTVFEGTRRRVEEFADGLQRPVFVLFSLGVVLPLMVGSMLPLMAVGGLGGGLWVAVLLMDVLFPFLFIIAARRILARRPLVRRMGSAARPPPARPARLALALVMGGSLVVLGVVLGGVALEAQEARAELDLAFADGTIASMDPDLRSDLETRATTSSRDLVSHLATRLGPLPVLWGVAAAVSIYLLPGLGDTRRRRDEVRAIEDGLPDALFQLGTRVADGMPLEPAMRRTADVLEGQPVAALLDRALAYMTLKRVSATEALFGRGGALAGFPSENVSASLKTVVEMVRKDIQGAGRAIVAISDHLRDLRRVDREAASRLRPVTDMMRSTATLFAPVILGITSALYLVVARLAPSLPLSSETSMPAPVPAGVLTLVLGVFVMAIACASVHFNVGLDRGDDPVETRYQVARALPLAVGAYSVASVVGQLVIS